MKTLKHWNQAHILRKWQLHAIRRFFALAQPDFLTVATPGSGKTVFSLKTAHELILAGQIERVVIVAPTEHLKRQWAESAARCGIDIDPNWTNAQGREAADYWGVAVTYQQVSFAPDLYDLNCARPTLVIFDEIHHAGDGLDWGVKLRHAFARASFRLALSGTPFRSDSNPIPFVSYEERRSRADFTYSYGEALAEAVCRPVYFPTVEGNVSWIRGNGAEINCSLLEPLSRQKSAERLRAALDADNEWLPQVLREADNRLTGMRLDGHADAAGLVIAIDQYHARKIAKLIKLIANEEPTLAISDEENSSRAICEFARPGQHRRWIVAVKMVSEGVDIPRLRVGVYATNTTSELFFRQFVGRFVRAIPGLDEQSAAVYLPADETLINHALAIKDEREHRLREAIKAESSAAANATIATAASNSVAAANPNQSAPPGNAELFAATENDFADLSYDENEMLFDEATGDYITPVELFPADKQPTADVFGGEPNQIVNARNGDLNSGATGNRSFIVPLWSEARLHDTVFDGARFSRTELGRADGIGKELGVRLPPAQIAAIIRRAAERSDGDARGEFVVAESSSDSSSASPTEHNRASSALALDSGIEPQPPALKAERKDRLRKQINRLANQLANQTGSDFDHVHRRWIVEKNGKPNRDATEAELERKLDWLQTEIKNFRRRPRN